MLDTLWPSPEELKAGYGQKIIFCVWLASAVKIVVAMTAELHVNLAWLT